MHQHIQWLTDRMAGWSAESCLIWNDCTTTYGEILDHTNFWRGFLDEHQVVPGEMVTLDGDYSPATVSLLLALIDRGAIVPGDCAGRVDYPYRRA